MSCVSKLRKRGAKEALDAHRHRPLLDLSGRVAAGGGLVLVQRLRPARRRLRHNDVAGFIYAVLGVAYAVLLGLVVAAVWEE